LISVGQMNVHGTLITAADSGISWIPVTLQLALTSVGALAVLWLQYFRRKTKVGRFVIAGFAVVILAAQLLPWRPAFAIERHFSARPGAAAGVELAFEAGLGKFKSRSNVALAPLQSSRDPYAALFLPLRSSGVQNDSIMISDRVDFHVTNGDGRQIYSGVGHTLVVDDSRAHPAERDLYQEVQVPMSFYAGVKERPVTVRTDYSLTLFGLASSYSLPALNGSERMPGLGWCQTEIDEAESAVELHCMQLRKAPVCVTIFLENGSTGAQNPPRAICNSNYGLSRPPLPDMIARYSANVPFRDLSGLAKYPVNGSQLAESRLVIRLYEPVDHFTRSLTIRNVRLQDWAD
jgi:hypothetical protein